jgi:beta-1,4-mannosyl-glycoprotein beta-1,4-N-acetylglucosaminyltransferase
MKIIDCFIFYNELDLLNYRLNVLNDVVDYFILVEATHTHSGKAKELFYENNKSMFSKFHNKIIHVIVDDLPYKFPNIDYEQKQQWANEKFQRNCGARGLGPIPDLRRNDYIIIADLDEIPDPRILHQIKNDNVSFSLEVYALEMHFYFYNLHGKLPHKWYHTKIISVDKLISIKRTFDDVRFVQCPIISSAGWHLSYFGDENFISNKLKNFAHQEFNNDKFTNTYKIKEKLKIGQSIFDEYIIEFAPLKTNPYLPLGYEKYLIKFITE